jgi:hypothetical protein
VTPRPLSEAKDEDMRYALVALERAALRAREIAKQTNTAIVVVENGEIVHIYPANEQITVP